LATNLPANGTNTLTDAGWNLSSDSSCGFTNSTSWNNLDARLSPLACNGGPTMTLALLGGSPAIDAGNTAAAPPTDQRGIPRPIGLAAEIGAFEYGMPLLTPLCTQGTGLDIVAAGALGTSCRLLMSTNLINWIPVATNPIDASGTALFHLDRTGSARFFRAAAP
jgi:hypothetical protein